MNGMHSEHWWAYTTGSDDYSESGHDEIPALPTVAQLSLINYYEYDDQSHVDLGFTKVGYLGPLGQTLVDEFPSINDYDSQPIVAREKMTHVEWAMSVSNCYASYLLNLFYWDHVS